MPERLVVLLALSAVVLATTYLVRWAVRRRVEAVIGGPVAPLLRRQLAKDGPTVVYFYGPHCGTCDEQRRVLNELTIEWGTKVLAFDATEQRALADSLGAVTIPTTAIIDMNGRVRRINVGFHPRSILDRQLVVVGGKATASIS